MFWRIIKYIWIIATIFVLVFSLYTSGGDTSSDISGLFLIYMHILTFPFGMLVQFVQIILYLIGLGDISNAYLIFTLQWLLFFSLGYLQWFVFVPLLYKKIIDKIKYLQRK